MRSLLRILATLCAVAGAVLLYPAQHDLAGIEHDARVAQMQIAHAVMLVTASGFTWPSGREARSRTWLGFLVGSSLGACACVPQTVSPPIVFLIAALSGLLGARVWGRV